MQIQCHNCRNPMTVNPQGGQFQCPRCGAVNAVGVPVQPGQPPQAHPRQQHVAKPLPKTDNRKAYVGVVSFLVSIVAVWIGWWGVLLGVGLLVWAILGALGKVTGPLSLVFPESSRTTALAVVGIMLSSFVAMFGAVGVVAQWNAAEKKAAAERAKEENRATIIAKREKQAADRAAEVAAHEAKLRANAGKAAAKYGSVLDVVDALTTEGKWGEAEVKISEAGALAEYKHLNPVPDEIQPIIGRQETLARKLEAKRKEREIEAWIGVAEEVVSDSMSCQTEEEVDAALKQVEGLDESDSGYAKIQELNAKLEECVKNMPPPSKWFYRTFDDPMGGQSTLAAIETSHSFSFDFPYHGPQTAMLKIRKDKGIDVILTIERGQFMCSMGCSVLVKFDDGEPQRWRAVGPADHSTETVFLRNTSKFVKRLKKADVVRIEAEFFQEGARVLKFPVARFDSRRLK